MVVCGHTCFLALLSNSPVLPPVSHLTASVHQMSKLENPACSDSMGTKYVSHLGHNGGFRKHTTLQLQPKSCIHNNSNRVQLNLEKPLLAHFIFGL